MRTKSTKAWVAAIGSTLTALTTALATVSVAVGDDEIDIQEISSLTTAAVTLIATVWAVWRVPNKPISAVDERHYRS